MNLTSRDQVQRKPKHNQTENSRNHTKNHTRRKKRELEAH